jgi:molybdopterin molybdotransferase
MHENCERIGNQVIIKDNVTKNQNIRPIGENLKKNEIVVDKGKIINAADIGQLAASGNHEIEVYKRIKVSVISTGDELVNSISKERLNGQIYDANRPMLLSLLNSNYLETIDMGIVKDKRKDLANKYDECLSTSDVVISSGGASDGVEDHTQNALKDIGAKCIVWQLAMKPGKPMAVGLLGKKIIFCLPGNPVAAFVCSKLLIKPLIIKLAGGVNLNPLSIKLPSGFEHNKKIGRAEYLRAKIVNENTNTFITLHGRKGAGVISSLTGADGIVEIPMEYKSVVKGELLNFYPFDHRGL